MNHQSHSFVSPGKTLYQLIVNTLNTHKTGPDGQNIFGHTYVLINDMFFVNANTCTF